jgi:hypothetical protein
MATVIERTTVKRCVLIQDVSHTHVCQTATDAEVRVAKYVPLGEGQIRIIGSFS